MLGGSFVASWFAHGLFITNFVLVVPVRTPRCKNSGSGSCNGDVGLAYDCTLNSGTWKTESCAVHHPMVQVEQESFGRRVVSRNHGKHTRSSAPAHACQIVSAPAHVHPVNNVSNTRSRAPAQNCTHACEMVRKPAQVRPLRTAHMPAKW